MPETLHRLIYRSTSAITGTSEEVEREIAAILAASRRRNAAAGVTGVLVHGGETFTQVLEGAGEAIEEVFDRITMDLRHSGFDLVQFIPVTERRFSDWRMAYVRQDALNHLWAHGAGEEALAREPERALREIAAALARQ